MRSHLIFFIPSSVNIHFSHVLKSSRFDVFPFPCAAITTILIRTVYLLGGAEIRKKTDYQYIQLCRSILQL